MKILIVTPSLSMGGVERVVRDLANGMSDRKHEIHVLSLTETNKNNIISLNDSIHLHEIPLKRSAHGIINCMKLFGKRKMIKQIVLSINPDIIHTHVFLYHSLAVFEVMRELQADYHHYHTIHTDGLHYSSNSLTSKIKRIIEKKIYDIFKTHVICISPIIMNTVRSKMHISSSRLYYIANGIDTQIYKPIEINKKKKEIKITYLARLDVGKNHITVLKALKEINDKYRINLPIKFIIMGDGGERQKLQNYVSLNSLWEFVEFKGNVLNVPLELNKCDIGVFPSEFEGCSIAILEMMASGLPMICSNIPAFNSIFDIAEVIFYETLDYKNLAQIIVSLINSIDKRSQYSASSLKIAKRFSLNAFIDKHEIAYNQNCQNHM